jgi:hypothetical protein
MQVNEDASRLAHVNVCIYLGHLSNKINVYSVDSNVYFRSVDADGGYE